MSAQEGAVGLHLSTDEKCSFHQFVLVEYRAVGDVGCRLVISQQVEALGECRILIRVEFKKRRAAADHQWEAGLHALPMRYGGGCIELLLQVRWYGRHRQRRRRNRR